MEQLEREAIPTKIIGGDRRLTMQLMGQWQDLRRKQRCPPVDPFLAAVPARLREDCFLLVPDDPGVGRLEQVGESIGRFSGISGTTLDLAQVSADTLLGVATRSIDQVLGRGAAFLDEGTYCDRDGRRLLFRAILLPLQDESGEIVRVFGGARCKPHRHDS